jgi:microcystin-dependent protein
MTPYVGEIRMFAGTFEPTGWYFCDGRQLPISENDVLFQLIGTTYGGDGESTFNLPNLQSRIPLHMGTGPDGTTYQIGEMAGVEQVTLTVQQTPSHTHTLLAANTTANSPNPADHILASSTAIKPYINDVANVPLTNNQITPAGGSQPHENMMPFLCINYIISIFGIFPSQT